MKLSMMISLLSSSGVKHEAYTVVELKGLKQVLYNKYYISSLWSLKGMTTGIQKANVT